jgi:hypothetical protein
MSGSLSKGATGGTALNFFLFDIRRYQRWLPPFSHLIMPIG